MSRLASDTGGNVLAMAAAALIPLLAMIGGAIDASRFYMAHTRLQQACDAGALAGRKAMNTVTALTTAEQAKAKEFFDFNFPAGAYSATNIIKDYHKGADGVVVGSASIDMPTAVMQVFGYTTVNITVACESTLNIPNTDVMFVLDVTGSMKDPVSSTETTSKMDGLKAAVKSFLSSLGAGAPTGPGRVRYGFMPYSANVNIGRLLYAANPSYLAGGAGSENWHYQSRQAVTKQERYSQNGAESGNTYGSSSTSTSYDTTWTTPTGSMTVNGTSYPRTYTSVTANTCVNNSNSYSNSAPKDYTTPTYGAQWPAVTSGTTTTTSSPGAPVYPESSQTTSYSTTQTRAVRSLRYTWAQTSTSGTPARGTCTLSYNDGTQTRTTPSTSTHSVTWLYRTLFDHWTYAEQSYDVSALVQNSTAQANPAYYSYDSAHESDPNNGAPSSFAWGGCIEEAQTVDNIVSTSSLTRPSGAYDLDIDLIPDSTATRWKPFLREVQYKRDGTWMASQAWFDLGRAPCPREASKLKSYAGDYDAVNKTSASFNSYVDSLQPIGGTYHDIGLIWGARFLSPDGIFASENRDSAAPGAYQVSRHIVFMTDGLLDTNPNSNDPWGITALDGRVAPTNTAGTDTRNDESHNRRVDIICNAMKAKGYTVWVIGFGIGTTLPTTLQNCASDAAHASTASDTATLRTRFAQIAQTIGGLRLSS